MSDLPGSSRRGYVDAVLDAYRSTPGVLGRVRASDRRLAARLFDDQVPLDVVRGAIALAAVRRLCRPDDAEPLQPVRSLHYFKPVIAELVGNGPDPAYLAYLQHTLSRLEPHDRAPGQRASGADDADCS